MLAASTSTSQLSKTVTLLHRASRTMSRCSARPSFAHCRRCTPRHVTALLLALSRASAPEGERHDEWSFGPRADQLRAVCVQGAGVRPTNDLDVKNQARGPLGDRGDRDLHALIHADQ